MSGTLDRRLSALVVNYNSGAFGVRCLDSLVGEWLREGRPRDALEIVVVDNASTLDQREHLERMEALGARIVHSDENRGYAAGINLALAHSSGAPDDAVAILNPDLLFLPGSVGALMDEALLGERVGAVDPRACVDPLGVLNLPPNLMPGPCDRFLVTAGRMSPWFCRQYSRIRSRRSLRWWAAEGPVESDMLSGCCLFLRRGVVEELGTLMDERFPLYFEDTDLFRRLARRGYRLVHHGGARILHHWSRSAAVGGEFQIEPLRRYEVSQRAFFRKYYGRAGEAWMAALAWAEGRWPAKWRHRPMHPLTELGDFGHAPVSIQLPRRCRYVLELAVDPAWIVACGVLGEGDRWDCPPETWDWWFQTDYYGRGLDLDTGELLGAWHFRKTTAGRTTPLEDEELARLGERVFGGEALRPVPAGRLDLPAGSK